MKIEVPMPKMGESLTEGTIIKWLKAVGDKVERDEMILEISTDKVDTEVPSPATGILTKILFNENDVVEVGKVIAEIETEMTASVDIPATIQKAFIKEEVVAPPPQIIKQEIASNSEVVDIVMPKMGESLTEGTIIKWLKAVGDKVERDEMILEISTDKVDTEVPSPVAGILIEILAKENEVIEVGKAIARISTGEIKISLAPITQIAEQAQPTIEQNISETQDTMEIPRQSGNRFYSPLVRSIAETERISLSELEKINGSGVDGRVTKDDLLIYIENKKIQKPVQSSEIIKKEPTHIVVKEMPKPPAVNAVKALTITPDDEIIPMSRIRTLIAEHMIFSKHTSAHVTSVAEADVTEIVKFRENSKQKFEQIEGFKLTYTPFFAKAIVDAVKSFPMVNVSVDGTNIIRHKRINLGIATVLPDGNLIVPAIKDAEMLNITGLARSVYDLSTRARTKKLNPEEIQGGTITLTNVGAFGTLFGTPVINQPESAIVGVGIIQKRPVVREFEGENLIVIRDMCYVTITYDHRVIDGMLAGRCLAAITQNLENMKYNTIQL